MYGKGGGRLARGKGGGKGGSGKGGGGKGRGGGKGGYDWRKHLPDGHPAKSGGDYTQAELNEYRTERRAKQSIEDAEVLQFVATQQAQQSELSVAPLSDAEQALLARQADERKLRALARDDSPADMWIGRAEGEALDAAIEAARREWLAAPARTRGRGTTEADGPMPPASGRGNERSEASAAQLQQQQERLLALTARAQEASAAHKRSSLPAWSARVDVVAAVRSQQVVVVSGETGCGKSTQVRTSSSTSSPSASHGTVRGSLVSSDRCRNSYWTRR